MKAPSAPQQTTPTAVRSSRTLGSELIGYEPQLEHPVLLHEFENVFEAYSLTAVLEAAGVSWEITKNPHAVLGLRSLRRARIFVSADHENRAKKLFEDGDHLAQRGGHVARLQMTSSRLRYRRIGIIAVIIASLLTVLATWHPSPFPVVFNIAFLLLSGWMCRNLWTTKNHIRCSRCVERLTLHDLRCSTCDGKVSLDATVL